VPRSARRHGPHQHRRPRSRCLHLAKLSTVVPDYPDLRVEITVDYGLAVIVA
jgi:hypothetical protein